MSVHSKYPNVMFILCTLGFKILLPKSTENVLPQKQLKELNYNGLREKIVQISLQIGRKFTNKKNQIFLFIGKKSRI